MRKKHPGIKSEQALNQIMGKKYKRIKNKVRMINIFLVVSLIIVSMISVILYNIVISFMGTVTGVSSNAIVSLLETKKKEEEKEEEPNWEWELGDGKSDASDGDSGGLYPTDPRLRLWAEVLEILKESEKATAQYSPNGHTVHPAFMFGKMGRESGNLFFDGVNSMRVKSLFKELLYEDPICNKGSKCGYISHSLSHFVGGTVSGGKDKGDVRKNIVDNSSDKYSRGKSGGGHANGYVQYESNSSTYDEFRYKYKDKSELWNRNASLTEVQQKSSVDKSLGFIRPNMTYMPDALYSAAMRVSEKPTVRGGNYDGVINSAEFKKLSKYNQDCIKFFYATARWGRGYTNANDDYVAKQLMSIVNSGKLKEIDDLLVYEKDKYFDKDKLRFKGLDHKKIIPKLQSKYGVDFMYGGRNSSYYGVYSLALGKIAYLAINDAVEKAPKEGGKPGAGAGKPGDPGTKGSNVYFVNVALKEEGYEETDNNYTKYGKWYGINGGDGAAWCAMFVSWCANQCGLLETVVPRYSAVKTGMQWYQRNRLFKDKGKYKPKAGDIFFQRSNGGSHTGIVVKSDDTYYYSIEGNSNDAVRKVRRKLTDSKLTGYGTPKFPIDAGKMDYVDFSKAGGSGNTR